MHQMLCTFYHQARDLVWGDPAKHLSCFMVVFEWICLSLFMGSCGSKYCQTGAHCHCFSHIVTDAVVGAHTGEPIAFILSDFCFLMDNDVIISPLDSLLKPSSMRELQICFCFDKSPINGCW